MSDDSPVEVRVIDAQGRAIRAERLAGGARLRVWMWEGRDDAGRPVAAGVYRALAASRAGGTSRSLVRVT